MSDDVQNAPVVADRATGAVTADLSDHDEPIARPAHWVASLLWIILVASLALVMIGAAATLMLNNLAPSTTGETSTMLALYMGSQGALVGLFVVRPGSR